MYGLLMDDIVKMSAGNFICHQIKIFTEINISEKQRGSIDYFGQRNLHRICVLGNEENIRGHITQDTVLVRMETISRHAVKYRTEKYFKNKLIKNFTYFDLGKKVNLNPAPNGHQTSSFISIFLSIITRKSM